MAGMRAVHKKNGTTFKYSGEQEERTWQQDSASWTH